MRTRKAILKNIMKATNWDGIRCIIKGRFSIREVTDAVKMQKEIDSCR